MTETNVLQLLNNLSPGKLSRLIQHLSSDTTNTTTTTTTEEHIEPPVIQKSYEEELNETFANFNSDINELKGLYQIVGDCEYASLDTLQILQTTITKTLKQAIFNKQELTSNLLNSIKSISKLFEIIKQFKDEINLSNYLSKNSQYLLSLYQRQESLDLDEFVSPSTSITSIMNELESSFIDLQPIFWDKLLELSKKSIEYHNLHNTIHDKGTTSMTEFADQLPTLDECLQVSNTPIEGQNKKFFTNFLTNLNLSNFKNLSPTLLTNLNFEIANLQNEIDSRTFKLNQLFNEISDIYHLLDYEDKDSIIVSWSNDNKSHDTLRQIGLNDSTINKYTDHLHFLQAEKSNRETRLDSYLGELEDYWSILSPTDDHSSKKITNFLKQNKNLKLSSFHNFDEYLKELETLKLQNISKFIDRARERIRGYWDLLMFDERERFKFKEFYIEDEYMMSENLLNIHNEEIARLRQKIEDLKPILESISQLNELIVEKEELHKSVSNPSRLLQRNSFKILKLEEHKRDKLQKYIPATIAKIRQLLKNYQLQNNGHEFRINGESYLEILNQLETDLLGKSRFSRTSRFANKTMGNNNNNKRNNNNNNNSSTIGNKSAKVVKRPVQQRTVTRPRIGETPTSRQRNFSAPSSTIRHNLSDPFDSREILLPTSQNRITPINRGFRSTDQSSARSIRSNNSDLINRLSPVKTSRYLPIRSQSLSLLKTPLLNSSNCVKTNIGLSPVMYRDSSEDQRVPELLSDSEISMTQFTNDDKENVQGFNTNGLSNFVDDLKLQNGNNYSNYNNNNNNNSIHDVSLNWDTETF